MLKGSIPGIRSGGASQLEEPLTSTQNVGGIVNGQTFPPGTSVIDIFQAMLVKEEPPVYLAPTLSLSVGYGNNSLHEIGTTLSLALSASYNQRDGGAATQVDFKEGSTIIASDNVTPFAYNYDHQLTANLSLKASVAYEQGPVKNTNLGNPSPDGQIAAGSKDSNTVTLKAVRRAFYGISAPSASSADVRALGQSLLNPANDTEFTINISAGATSVIFAYPASLPTAEKVTYVEGLNADVKGVFTETTVSVEGAEGYSAIDYRVYRYEPSEPFSQAATYIAKI